MVVFVSGYINDLSAVNDNIILRVRVLRSWTQVIFNKPHVKNLEMILMDENNTKMQATCRMANVNQFKHKLVEGAAIKLERYSLGEIQPKYRMVNNALRLSFLRNTLCEPCTDFTGSMYGFDFRGYKSITDLQMEEDGQFVFPKEITELVGKRLAFKVSIDEYNQKKMLPVFTVLRLSADVDILSALTSSVTPMKEGEATSSKCVGISALDLESQTDETVTPTNVLKSTATSPPVKTSSGKRPSDDGPSTKCSKTKRQIVDIKMEKNP
ncbi:nucleic acid-binding, OB-fold protein [Artemisia annua]|uniref:Nucleic acid-binding, OB-fold protein n=1 Tax=Artemisia annua TaxID=35608 RepID=A0A2U1KFS0_ARTAN|nr:nucleic acid-binding, OB-fold protein [Artemisia annua]